MNRTNHDALRSGPGGGGENLLPAGQRVVANLAPVHRDEDNRRSSSHQHETMREQRIRDRLRKPRAAHHAVANGHRDIRRKSGEPEHRRLGEGKIRKRDAATGQQTDALDGRAAGKFHRQIRNYITNSTSTL